MGWQHAYLALLDAQPAALEARVERQVEARRELVAHAPQLLLQLRLALLLGDLLISGMAST